MNDAEIIKGLECCRHSFCCDCPYEKYSENCTDKLLAEAHRFVKHQQAEIERLKKIQQRQADLIIEERGRRYELASQFVIAKSEAIRKFADALKSKSELVAPSVYAVPYRAVSVDDIDKLVKRMTGGNKYLTEGK